MQLNSALINSALAARDLQVMILSLPQLPETWMAYNVGIPPTCIRFLKSIGIIEQVTRLPVTRYHEKKRYHGHEWRVTRLWYEWASYFQLLKGLDHTIHPLPRKKKVKRNPYIPL